MSAAVSSAVALQEGARFVYLINVGVFGTVSVSGAFILGTFLAGQPSDALDTVDAVEQVDKVLSRADLLSGSFFCRFLAKRSTLVTKLGSLN